MVQCTWCIIYIYIVHVHISFIAVEISPKFIIEAYKHPAIIPTIDYT